MNETTTMLLFALAVMVVVWLLHEVYQWGLITGRAEATLENKKRVFRAMHDTCEHSGCTAERRSGAYELLRRVVQ